MYIGFSYFVTILALSISYYHFFKEEWKDKISFNIIVIYILLYQITAYYLFNFVNILLNMSSSVYSLATLVSASFVGLYFLIADRKNPLLDLQGGFLNHLTEKDLLSKKRLMIQKIFPP